MYSIGHGARKEADFILLLQQYGIEYLADVRSFPFSRFHPQFNRRWLEKSLTAAGIRYVFMGDTLGGRPADKDCYDAAGHIDYSRVAGKDFFRKGLERLVEAARQKVPLAIMCSERGPAQCHRSKLIGVALQQSGINLKHIDEQGYLKSQQEVIATAAGNSASGRLFD